MAHPRKAMHRDPEPQGKKSAPDRRNTREALPNPGGRSGVAAVASAQEKPSPDELRLEGMGRCEVCGNTYDKAFTITMADKSYVFDSFECAIYALAPACERCGIRIVGHGVEAHGSFFCCAHCAEQQGVAGIRDRI